jgi:hypothetical protein
MRTKEKYINNQYNSMHLEYVEVCTDINSNSAVF